MRPETGLWQDVSGLPESLAAREGVEDVAALLGAQGVRRIVATGNGAAYYVAFALWVASLEGGGRSCRRCRRGRGGPALGRGRPRARRAGGGGVRQRSRVGGGARGGAPAQGGRGHPRRGRRDPRGRHVGDDGPAARTSRPQPAHGRRPAPGRGGGDLP